ncbi:NACHT and WD repeat domain-containing protein 2 [Solea solea]|uniref:NACHT and WD repeat domain-containing protein 2 n=1 Tax=Solea solea TaxID=90069 RepID=UPI00272ACB03|nr:NACHT and WD repeat domain-containing protein 2 [Solea solea]
MCSRGKPVAQNPPDSTCRSSCVKLYLCSNPQDSVLERKALRESVFPKLGEHCRKTWGLDLRVIDPFESSDPCCWPDECTRQQLIKECRESSAGPYLLALVGHQYGSASVPTQVDVPEYELLLQQSQQAGVSTQVLERFYQRDENTIPPSYCLRPPHTHTCSPQSEISKEEQNEMKATEEELKKVFQIGASLCVHSGLLSPEKAVTYYRSALDTDLRFALDTRPDNDTTRRCLVYIHRVVAGETEKEKEQAATSAPTGGQLLSELRDKFLPDLVTSCQHLVYATTTQCDRRYGYTTARRRSYANSLGQQVYSDVVGLIDSVNRLDTVNRKLPVDALTRGQAEQEELCSSLSKLYDVIRPEEEEIRAYVTQSDRQCPLLVLGGPCTGKTVLLAHSAQQIKSWLPDSDPVVITYFCNLDPLCSPCHLLSSLCYQIANRYHGDLPLKNGHSFNVGTDPDNHSCITDPKDYNSNDCTTCNLDSHHEPTTADHVFDANLNLCATQCPHCYTGLLKPDITVSDLKEHFSFLVSRLPSSKQPLILNLDGLDQIESNLVCSQIIESLPSPVPPGIGLILTVSSSRAQVLEAIKQHYAPSSPPHSVSAGSEREMGCVCVQLGLVDRKECGNLLASLLRSSGRRVTSGQQALVNQAMTSCCLTLYARLLHVHTSLWHSDSDVTESTLPSGIHASISALLDHLEQKHGSSLVARAVSYLTLSWTGLTEVELADFLSVNDELLSVCVQRGESRSFRMRVLQIDVERLLLDLQRFLIRRTFVRSRVLLWVSRHFKLVVAKRYLGTQEARRGIHSELADYFSGRWARGNAKPLLSEQKLGLNAETVRKKKYKDRQPFIFTCSSTRAGQVNLRKVIELPYHLQQSGRWEELEQGLLMSLGFHQAMVQGGLLKDLVNMLQSDKSQFQLLRERQLLAETLKSSAFFLQHVPLQLPTVMETSLLPYLEVFPALKGYVREIREKRRKRGHGLGLVLCPAPSSVPPIQHLKCDFSVAEAAGTACGIVAEIADNGAAWIWKGSGCDVEKMSLNCEQKDLKFAGVKSSGRFLLLSSQCNKVFLWDVTGPEKLQEVEGPLKPNSYQDAPNKITGFVECQRKIFMWWKDERFVSVFDVSSQTLTHFQCQTSVTCLVCSSNGFYMYCGQEDGTVSIFDTDSCCLLSSCTNSNHGAVTWIIVSEEKREVTCVDRTGNVTVWDVATKTKPARLVKERFTDGESSNVLNHDYSEGIKMCLVCQSHQVSLWDTCDWELWDQFLAPQGRAFTQAVLSQGGHLFLAVLDTCSLVLAWKISTGQCVLSLEASQQPHALFKSASDLICVAHGGCLTVWDSEMIDAAGTAPKTGCGVKELVVEETAERFYTTDGSETVWRWSLTAGFPHANFLHDGPVEKLCLSPDNIHLVTLSAGEIYIWQTETGQNILRISGSRATDILITPNNNFGVSISKQGLSHVWKLVHGSIVCSIHLHLSNAKVSPESTFLIGCHQGDLLAASLWSGSICKRFSCAASSEHVVAFHTLSEQPDFVVVMTASGAVYTWKVAEETLCKHFQLPCMIQCQPQNLQMSSDGRYTLLSTDNNTVNLLDLSQVRLRSFKVKGPVVKASMDQFGRLTAYISREKICDRDLHTRPVLTVIRLADGERVGTLWLSKNPLSLVVCKQQCVYVGFEDGSVGVYSVSDVRCREKMTGVLKQCPCDSVSSTWLPLATPNVKWP